MRGLHTIWQMESNLSFCTFIPAALFIWNINCSSSPFTSFFFFQDPCNSNLCVSSYPLKSWSFSLFIFIQFSSFLYYPFSTRHLPDYFTFSLWILHSWLDYKSGLCLIILFIFLHVLEDCLTYSEAQSVFWNWKSVLRNLFPSKMKLMLKSVSK